MTRPTSTITLQALGAFAMLASACAEPQCPDGFDKIGKICRRHDGGLTAEANDGAMDEGAHHDDAGERSLDGGAGEMDSGVVEPHDAGMSVDSRIAEQHDATSAGERSDAGVDSGVGAGPLLDRAVAVALGQYHSCALLEGGAVKCWGSNRYGELGDGTLEPRLRPQIVPGVNASKIASSGRATCAITKPDGAVRCWGLLEYGSTGTYGAPQAAPVAIPGVVGAVDVAITGASLRGRACAALSTGVVTCWTAHPGSTQYVAPAPVAGVAEATAVAGGSLGFCALQRTADVLCWGHWYAVGGSSPFVEVPTPTKRFSNVEAVAQGTGGNVCVVLTSGRVQCMGNNNYGQLGDGQVDSSASAPGYSAPRDVLGFTTGAQIGVGFDFACVLLENGTVNCWGRKAALGSVTTDEANPTPQRVVDVSSATAIGVGEEHACAVRAGGGIRCWGTNGNGQLGDLTTINAPTAVPAYGFAGS